MPSGHIDSAKHDGQMMTVTGWSASTKDNLSPRSVLLVDGSFSVLGAMRRYRRVDVEQHFGMKEDLACLGCRHGWTFEFPFNSDQQLLGLKVVSIFDDGTASLMPVRFTQ